MHSFHFNRGSSRLCVLLLMYIIQWNASENPYVESLRKLIRFTVSATSLPFIIALRVQSYGHKGSSVCLNFVSIQFSLFVFSCRSFLCFSLSLSRFHVRLNSRFISFCTHIGNESLSCSIHMQLKCCCCCDNVNAKKFSHVFVVAFKRTYSQPVRSTQNSRSFFSTNIRAEWRKKSTPHYNSHKHTTLRLFFFFFFFASRCLCILSLCYARYSRHFSLSFRTLNRPWTFLCSVWIYTKLFQWVINRTVSLCMFCNVKRKQIHC